MKKKHIVIRIMFIITLLIAALIAYKLLVRDAMSAVAITTSKTISYHNEEVVDKFSNEIKVLSNELNTKVDSLKEENEKLRKVIEKQGKQIDQLSGALKKLGVTFQ